MSDLTVLKAANAKRWENVQLTRNFDVAAKRLVAAKAHYQTVEKTSTVPWFIIAVIHERESSQAWDRSLAQGDPWNRVSVHVPAGRGPFKSWEDAAVDALCNCAPHAARWNDWTPGGALTLLEQYNGLGYASCGRPSPYIWSGTTVYDPPDGPGGKILVDHGPIEDWHDGKRVVDKQLGCAGLLIAMSKLDSDVVFARQVQPRPKPDQPKPVPKPISKPVSEPIIPTNFWSLVVSILKTIFRRS